MRQCAPHHDVAEESEAQPGGSDAREEKRRHGTGEGGIGHGTSRSAAGRDCVARWQHATGHPILTHASGFRYYW